MENPESHKESNPFEGLANKLDAVQQVKNDGRGVSCVQTIIAYLRRGDARKAKVVCWNEADKIVHYSDIRKILQQELFFEDNEKDIPPHFLPSSDKLYDKES